MSDLTALERLSLEKLFGMETGYVLSFSDRPFQDFIVSTTGKDIDEAQYSSKSTSKANRLRVFWKKENNYVVAKLLENLLEYIRVKHVSLIM